ncbi:MAG: patatin-like phospholipase family protein [Hydrogenibacillus schlegelii]|nr:patatin-like phospholipase family protein [Hydrogenibacillus schlegelii]
MAPKVGLALGSGGVRGFAHLGVLKVLEEYGIPIDFLAGSSMGSVVAVTYASGIELRYLIKLAEHMRRSLLVDYTVPRLGLLKGERVRELVALLTKNRRLEELPIPTAVVATDLMTGEAVVLREGPIADAVRASVAIPGIFEPVEWQGRLLVDGGVVDRVPMAALRAMGADVVIGVDVSRKPAPPERIRSIYEVILQTIDIMESQIFQGRIHPDDILITPAVGQHSPLNFQNVSAIIAEGERAARAAIGTILERLGRVG